MKVLTAAVMQELDRRTIMDAGIPGAVLMENAGRGVADTVVQRFADCYPGPVLILCGRGNNGGDGFVVARALKRHRVRTEVILAVPAKEIHGPASPTSAGLITFWR